MTSLNKIAALIVFCFSTFFSVQQQALARNLIEVEMKSPCPIPMEQTVKVGEPVRMSIMGCLTRPEGYSWLFNAGSYDWMEITPDGFLTISPRVEHIGSHEVTLLANHAFSDGYLFGLIVTITE